MTAETVRVDVTHAVGPDERAQVLAIEKSAIAADGLSPLDDQVRLDLEFADAAASTHLLARLYDDPAIVGYAHLADTEPGEPRSGHLVVEPGHRRRGIGTVLIDRMTSEAAPEALQIWAHGDDAAARFLSGRLGFRRVRDLWQMQGDLAAPLARPSYPSDIDVRAFVPGQDDEAWVELNAVAFADHPEQGKLTTIDLRQRMDQPWFDPHGFFVAEREDKLLGFHWTKVHHAADKDDHDVGEVYAVGVHPSVQGLGLGKALTLTGLIHLKSLGLPEVRLYVEADNRPAVAVYQKLGFDRISVDVMYQRP